VKKSERREAGVVYYLRHTVRMKSCGVWRDPTRAGVRRRRDERGRGVCENVKRKCDSGDGSREEERGVVCRVLSCVVKHEMNGKNRKRQWNGNGRGGTNGGCVVPNKGEGGTGRGDRTRGQKWERGMATAGAVFTHNKGRRYEGCLRTLHSQKLAVSELLVRRKLVLTRRRECCR